MAVSSMKASPFLEDHYFFSHANMRSKEFRKVKGCLSLFIHTLAKSNSQLLPQQ